MTKIKICGITNQKDADDAVRLGADMLGFVFHKGSRRYADPRSLQAIVKNVPARVMKVGVFFNEPVGMVEEIVKNGALDFAQLHGEETPEMCTHLGKICGIIKAFRVKRGDDLARTAGYEGAAYYLFDTFCEDLPGGTGEVFDWKILADKIFTRPVIISGGLTPGNVGAAVKMCAPDCVDVSSGVEISPGKKDAHLMKQFIDAVRRQ